MNTGRRVAVLFGLVASLAAQGAPVVTIPDDIRAALFALSRHEPAATGVTVTALDDATSAPLPRASVFVVDGGRLGETARVPRTGFDMERLSLALPLIAGRRYETDERGTVVVPAARGTMIHVVTASGSGWSMLGRSANGRAGDAALPDAIEVRVAPFHDYVVRAVGAGGVPVVGVPVEFGVFGENGTSNFTAMLGHPTDARGEARLRLDHTLATMLARRATLAVQVALVGGEPVRRPLTDVPAGGTVELAVPPHGRAIVRLYDEREQPLAGLTVADLRAVSREEQWGPPSVLPSGAKAQRLDGDAAHFEFVALGKQLVATVQSTGIAGWLEHAQDGPTREGELVVFGVRVAGGAPALAMRVLEADGTPAANGEFAVLFEIDGVVKYVERGSSDAAGFVRLALPADVAERGGVAAIWRRPALATATTTYGGAVRVAIAGATPRLREVGDVRLGAEPPALVGRLVDAAGAPLAGIAVRMLPTRAEDRLLGVGLWFETNPLQPLLVHRATTAADGTFTFRELEPAATAVGIELGGGEWMLEAETLRTGGAEQRLVAHRAGSMHVAFARRPPAHLVIELKSESGARQRATPGDPETGARTWHRLRPGRYELTLRLSRQTVVRLDGLVVGPGERCDDPRLRAVDWTLGLRVVDVRVRTPEGRPTRIGWTILDDRGRSLSMGSSVEDGEPLVLPDGAQRLVFASEHHRTVVVDEIGASVDIVARPRRVVQLHLAAGLELPAGLGVFAASPNAPAGRATWAGNRTPVLVDSDKEFMLELRSTTVDRGPGVELWKGAVALPAGGAEPVIVELPLDAAAIAAIREKLQTAPAGR